MTNSVILLVDDDDDDRLLVRRAIEKSGIPNELHAVRDGIELLDYLKQHCSTGRATPSSLPRLILLDLNMPRMDGQRALRQLKSIESLKAIPVIVFTTSQAEHDMETCYHLGCASYITKPASFGELVEIMKSFSGYFLNGKEVRRT